MTEKMNDSVYNDSAYMAIMYRLQAVNFQMAAKTLSDTMETKPDGRPAKITAIPFYFLISHAAELFLKAALLKRGFTESDLKKYDCRHNLTSLMKALQEKGVSITLETVYLINGLHSQHQNHALRYTALVDDGQKTYMPPVPMVLNMLDELLLLTRISTQGV